MTVTGPSLTSATFILAWKRPVATETPAARSRCSIKMVVEFLGVGQSRRICERAAIPLYPAGIKSELRDNQNLAAGSQKRKVHLALLVFEDTKFRDLFYKEIGVRHVIKSAHTW
jgi:hypothetical protein